MVDLAAPCRVSNRSRELFEQGRYYLRTICSLEDVDAQAKSDQKLRKKEMEESGRLLQ